MLADAFGQFLPFAIGVALSPIPIIGIVLMLGTPRARVNGPAFVAGWICALAVVGTVVLLFTDGAGADDGGSPAEWVSVAQIMLGVVLLGVAVRQWRNRPRDRETVELPTWLAHVDRFGAGKAAGVAILMAVVNPKNLILVLGAVAAIAEAGGPPGEQALALAIFVAISSTGVVFPAGLYFALGERSERALSDLKGWMARHSGAITAVIFLVLAAKLIGDGISGI